MIPPKTESGSVDVRTLENTDSGVEVVNTAGGLQGSSEDLNGGNEIVGEAVVQVTLGKADQFIITYMM